MQLNNTMIDSEIIQNIFNQNNSLFFFSFEDNGNYYCSETFSEKIGYSLQEIDVLPFKHYSLAENNLGESLYNSTKELLSEETKGTKEIIYSIKNKTEEIFWFKEIFKVTKNSEGKIQVVSFAVDITDLKIKEEQLNKVVQEKARLNKSKDKLISIISHDLRAPFTSLLGFTEILLNEPDLPKEERIEYIEFIHEASKIQLEMVNHLLDWTHLQNGTMKFNPQRLNIADIASNCISVLTGVSIRKDIEIKLEGLKDLFVTADERLVNQVITNLLSNALKFTPSGKKVTVSIGEFKSDMVEVIVRDEGIGISEKNQVKMFNIDTKFSLTGTAGEKGSGLGLTLVKEIVEKHSGKIWFYSKENEGSEFHFTLPKAEDLILIVEDNTSRVDEYKDVLDTLLPNYNIVFSKNGFEALSLLTEKKPSVVISYHKMPLMGGVQLVSSLREKDTHKSIPVIIVVDEVTEEIKEKYSNYGKTFFVETSTTIDELTTKLIEILN
jgi:signal transduction histidine kinase